MSNFHKHGFVYPFDADNIAHHDNIKDYYTTTFPDDELGVKLDETATFQELYHSVLKPKGDVYKYVGVSDSLVRERLFDRISEIYGIPYDDIYGHWLELEEDTMETYSKKLIERRISLAMDEIESMVEFLKANYPREGQLAEVKSSLNNIEIALDFNDDESDKWTFYSNGSRAHLNK